jgi:hypothetical protein
MVVSLVLLSLRAFLRRSSDFATHCRPYPEERCAAARLEGWLVASWFETALRASSP